MLTTYHVELLATGFLLIVHGPDAYALRFACMQALLDYLAAHPNLS